MLEHGGRLRRAALQYGIAVERWLDLSTGISPFAWPLPEIPAEAWRRLPEDDDGLEAVARHAYGIPHLLPVAGTQAALQALPRLRRPSRVGVIEPGYAEHAQAWARAGHTVERRPARYLLDHAEAYDVVVLIHPNNPGGDAFDPTTLLRLHAALSKRDGWLVVDEAFIDATPERSLCACSDREGLVVLRSLGKFFGLAGARTGFVCATPALLAALRESLGPWCVSGPARHLARLALQDRAWQAAARQRLASASMRLGQLLAENALPPTAGCAFFQWCVDARAAALQRALAERAILVRRFEEPPSLRFGIPADEPAWQRLGRALAEATAA